MIAKLSGKIKCHAGLTLGSHYSGFNGSPLQQEITCLGDTTNLAVRLMSAAPWGEIWCNERLYQAAGHLFKFIKVNKSQSHGIENDAFAFFRLIDRKQNTISAKEKIIGRKKELEQLNQAVKEFLSYKKNSLINIIGERGSGKHRLLDEIKTKYQEKLEWISIDSDLLVKHPPKVLTQLIQVAIKKYRVYPDTKTNQNDYLSRVLNCIPFSEVKKIRTEPQDFIMDSERQLARLSSLEYSFDEISACLLSIFEIIAQVQPLGLIIKDYDHNRLILQDFVSMLLLALKKYPTLFILTSNVMSDIKNKFLPGNVSQSYIYLRPLSKRQIKNLALELMEEKLNSHQLSQVFSLSKGNALFVKNLILNLAQGEKPSFISAIDDHGLPQWILANRPLSIPFEIRKTIVAQFDQFPREFQKVVKNAVVLGEVFDSKILGLTLDNSVLLPEHLEYGKRIGLWSELTENHYQFYQPLFRDVIFHLQSIKDRRHLQKLITFQTGKVSKTEQIFNHPGY